MSNIQRLSENDWAEILPGKEFTLGSTVLVIEPFGIADLAKLAIQMKALFKAISESDITTENFDTPENLVTMFKLVMANAPGVLETACGLHRDDIARLPVIKSALLLKEVIEVNIESQDDFAGAMKYLGKLLGPKMPQPTPAQTPGE